LKTLQENFPLNEKMADAIITAALTKCQEWNVSMNIAIVNGGANLKAFKRMDGAWLGSIDIAWKKGETAHLFDMTTRNLGELSQPGGSLFNFENSDDGSSQFLFAFLG